MRFFVAQQVAALAAGRQAKAWHFIETFYAEQVREGTHYVTQAYLREIAAQVSELDLEQWSKDPGDRELLKEIAGDAKEAENAGLKGTPSFLIGAAASPKAPFSATDSASFDAAIETLLGG